MVFSAAFHLFTYKNFTAVMERKNSLETKDVLWYKDAIIYELHIKAFRDSNGDGIGDFGGLLEKLDYLQELGLTAIWVLPFYPSPLKDDGYDIADYYAINPRYGSIEQFQQFLAEAHKRNLKVITELVINHTSDQHPWFQRARTAPKGSPEREFYVWSDDPEKYKDVRIIFQDFEASNWTWDPIAKQYYWHRFFHHQPDLNYDNELVQQEIIKVLDYWCAMGVDGFRLDAVPYLYEREGTNGENLPETHTFLKKLRSHIDEHFPGTVFLAEANMWPEDSASYFGNGNECHMNYHFPVMPRMFMAVQQENRYPITDIFDQTPAIPENCQWAIFLRNHDELTLEMVTDEERDFMYKVYAKDPKARINLGIRHRLAPLMDNDRKRIELMNALLFSLPGTPVVYYGDEIGMGDNFYLGDRDGVRTPMQWSPDRNAGFSAANPHQLYLPVILDPEYSYEAVNVELQRRNTSSLFWFMKRIIAMRRNHEAFGRGSMQFIHVENPKVLAFIRSYGEENILVIVNLSKHVQPAEIDLKDYKGAVPVEAFSKNRFPPIKEDSPYFFTLSAHSYQWFILQKVSELSLTQNLPAIEMGEWNELAKSNLQTLEKQVLPVYLQPQNWFNPLRRQLHNLLVIEHSIIEVEKSAVHLLLIETSYESGLPELYQLPLFFIEKESAKKITDNCPEAVLANVKIASGEGVICDAYYTSEFQHYLLQQFSPSPTNTTTNAILFNIKEGKKITTSTPLQTKLNNAGEAISTIVYGNLFQLKIFRKLDWGINPTIEIVDYLNEQKKFNQVQSLLGAVEWTSKKGTVILGMLQEGVENHGDGYAYMLERIGNFIERILAADKSQLAPAERIGSFAEPVQFDELPESLQTLLGARAAEQARLIGVRTAEMHLALGADTHVREFIAEEFSLHYQRSLFSSMQSLVRETYQLLARKSSDYSTDLQKELNNLTNRKDEILSRLKRIYSNKLDVVKIRIHGDFDLKTIVLTGKDLLIQNFGSNSSFSFSERRLKRSPMKDVANMMYSFYEVAYSGFLNNDGVSKEDLKQLFPFAEQWAFFMSSFFFNAYQNTIAAAPFLPAKKEEKEVFIQTYLIEKAVQKLNQALKGEQPIQAPLHLLLYLLKQ